MSSIIAIDPGVSGGIAFSIKNRLVEAYPMPDTIPGMIYLLKKYKCCVANLFIEQVSGYVGSRQPGSRMFTFGQNYGELLGICVTLGYSVHSITPQRWQRALGLYGLDLAKAERKRYFRKYAQKLYPKLKVTLKTADALLLLKYGKDEYAKNLIDFS